MSEEADTILTESFHDRSMSLPYELLRGAIDIHVHAGPHLRSSPRRADPIEVAELARDAGMRALVYMDVFKESAGIAWMVRRLDPGIEVFGGIILNSNYDGLNPRAVKTALQYGAGAKFVSFGAHSTHYLASREGRMVDGRPVTFQELYPAFAAEELSRAIRIPLHDPVPDPLAEILDLIAERPEVYLNTGHVSAEEALRLIELAQQRGIEKVLVAHVARRQMTIEQQKEAVRHGAFLEVTLADYVYPAGIPRSHYYVEREYMPEVLLDNRRLPEGFFDLKAALFEIGVENFVLASDYGIRATPTPVEGMRQFVACLLDMDVDVATIRALIRDNPARMWPRVR
jgi:hypothetical protein